MAASGEGHVSVVKVLLDGGANPDLLNANGVSALIWACTKGNLEVVNVLLELESRLGLAIGPSDLSFDHFQDCRLLAETLAERIADRGPRP